MTELTVNIADPMKPTINLESEAAQSGATAQITNALLDILAIGHTQIDRADHVDGDEFFANLGELDRQQKIR
ncbi:MULTISPECIES: prevent-host-death protein [Caballeronia]|uniref:prevent-host-death protein n=1 Tax=Caballeronia TaxID=1827195 RepID=UPI000AF31D57|nr:MULTISPECIES: prevent-host-death protein [Caballeronia]